MFALVNGVFYTGQGVINNMHMLVDDGRIVGFVPRSGIPNKCEIIDVQGGNVAPGFIDLQINGAGGEFFKSGELLRQVPIISNILAKNGVTRWMPTFLSINKEQLIGVHEESRFVTGNHGVLGFHFEGPWIDEQKAGVHSTKAIRAWEEDDTNIIKALAKYSMVCITLSSSKIKPSILKELTEIRGVKVLLGHSLANYEEAIEFFSLGGSGVTHIFNAMNQPSSREPGIVVAAMDSKNIYVSVIADLFHVAPPVLRLLKRSFDPATVFFVSDAMPVIGSINSSFSIAENACNLSGGRIIDEHGRLAGSAIVIADAVRNCIQKVGIPMDEAIRMGTLYPARFLGIEKEYGLLDSGYKADFTIFNNQINVVETYRDGTLIYGTS